MISTIAAPAEREEVRSSPRADGVALIGRMLLAAIFVLSGIGKVADPAGTIAYINAAGLPVALIAYAGAVAVEVGGGIALALGYRTKISAAALAIFSVLAALFFHSTLSDQNQLIHFFKNIAIAGGLLQIVAFGGGRWSLDARRA